MITILLALLDRLSPKSDTLFVQLAYRVTLGRAADPGGLANAVAKLQQGYSRASLVHDLVTSAEFLNRTRTAREEIDAKTYDVFGTPLTLHDVRGHAMRDVVVGELLQDVYGIEHIAFAPGDVVIDVGGNLGVVSIYIARKHPGVRVILYEPVPDSHRLCLRNIEANGVADRVTAVAKAVTSDGRPLTLAARRDFLGGASANYDGARVGGADHVQYAAESITLDRLFAEHAITRCKLLKIDCEGSEHEILRAATVLDRVEYLSGEFHINARLAAQGHSLEGLRAHAARFIAEDRIRVTTVTMGD